MRSADRIVIGMAQPMMIGETRVVIGASAGAAMFPEHGLTQDDLFKHADVALYKSKACRQGRLELVQQRHDGSRRNL